MTELVITVIQSHVYFQIKLKKRHGEKKNKQLKTVMIVLWQPNQQCLIVSPNYAVVGRKQANLIELGGYQFYYH